MRRHAHGQVGEHVVPARQRARPARLAEVADQGHRARRAAAGEHAPLHRGEVLRLVDEHVAERARLAVVVARRPASRRRSARARRRRWCTPPTPELVDRAARPARARASRRPRRRRARARRARRPEERVGFVDQREVGVGPRDRRRRRRPRSRNSSALLLVGEHAVGRGADERLEPEQVVHQLGAAEHRPHALERGAHLGQRDARGSTSSSSHSGGAASPRARPAATVGSATVAADRSAVSSSCCTSASRRARSARYARTSARRYSRRKWSNTSADDERAALVVRAAPRVRALDDARGVAPAHAQHVAVERDDDVARQRALAVADRRGDHLRHADVALHRGGGRRARCRAPAAAA